MRRVMILGVALALVVGLCWEAGAQIDLENHYLVYESVEPNSIILPITIYDQFDQWYGSYSTDDLVMDKFANPVQKNNEPIFNFNVHQTWWLIDHPQPIKQVGILNQFGHQIWDVGNGRYLVLPALKDEPGEIPIWNHYKCYEADGPLVDIPVDLVDQWGAYASMAVDPVLFCNPCIKELENGLVYEIVNNEAHLAVYRLQPPPMTNNSATAYDQFGIWPIFATDAIWLVVPSQKLTVVENEKRTWGSIKSLYR